MSAPGSGKAKGKGKAPPPPLHGRVESGGKGRGKNRGESWQPPEELRAPAPLLNAHHSLNVVDGTLWQGLGLWAPPLPHPLSLEEEDGDNDHAVALISPMECLEIDFDRLLSFWNVPDDVVESTHQDTVSDGQLLSASFAQAVEIAMKVYELTPAIVQCALTEDASVLSAEQAIALENLAHGVEQYSAGDFNAAVARLGIEALGKPESLVYSIMSVPNGTARALILGAHHSVQEDIAIIESCSRGLGNLVDRFEVSRSFKTMLQVVLVIQNVLSQQCSFALKTKCLPRLGHQKVGHNRVSMGGAAALDFARRFGADRVSGLAVLAGYYDTQRLEELVEAIRDIPLRVVHHRKDHCVKFAPMEALIAKRRSLGAAKTAAIISDEEVKQTHQISVEERSRSMEWLLQVAAESSPRPP